MLVFGICVLIGGSKLSNDFGTIIQHGLFLGPFFFLFLGPAHFALRFVVDCTSDIRIGLFFTEICQVEGLKGGM